MKLVGLTVLLAFAAATNGDAKSYQYFWNFNGAPKLGERGFQMVFFNNGQRDTTFIQEYGNKPEIQEGLRNCRQICVTENKDGSFKPYSYDFHSPAVGESPGMTSVTRMTKEGVLSTRSDYHYTRNNATTRWYHTATLDLRNGRYTFHFHSDINNLTSPEVAKVYPVSFTTIDYSVESVANLRRQEVQRCPEDSSLTIYMPNSDTVPASIAADGDAYVRVVFTATTPGSVTFSVTSTFTPLRNKASLSRTAPSLGSQPGTDTTLSAVPLDKVDEGSYKATVYLRAPDTGPDMQRQIQFLTVKATHNGEQLEQKTKVSYPPLLLVHGIWSSAGVWESFRAQIQNVYPGFNQIYPVNYAPYSHFSFATFEVQWQLTLSALTALSECLKTDIACAQVDVVAHSMGGLATQRFARDGGRNSLNKLITIGTPYYGSPLAAQLTKYKNQYPAENSLIGRTVPLSPRLRTFMALGGQFIDSGAESLVPGSADLQSIAPAPFPYYAIAGSANGGLLPSVTEVALNRVLNAYTPEEDSVDSLLGPWHDAIVPDASQLGGGYLNYVRIAGITHSGPDSLTETNSPAVVAQVATWLSGGDSIGSSSKPVTLARTADVQPVTSLDGWTEVQEAITTSPADSAQVAIGVTSHLSVSSGKAIQSVIVMAPFGVLDVAGPYPAVPLQFRQTGPAEVHLLVLFTDKTYSKRTLSFTVVAPSNLQVLKTYPKALVAEASGTKHPISVSAHFQVGEVDATKDSSFSLKSGTNAVASVDAKGEVTLLGNGTDAVVIQYGGKTVEVPVSVGNCPLSIPASTRSVAAAGGIVQANVVTPPGCSYSWTSDAAWAVPPAAGSGNAIANIQIAANTTADTRAAVLRAGDATLIITQPPASCTLSISGQPSSAPPAGSTFDVNVHVPAGCPWTSSSDAPWLALNATGNLYGPLKVTASVQPNTTGLARTANVFIGNSRFSVSQSSVGCDFTLAPASVSSPAAGLPTHKISLGLGPNCPWTSSSNAPWVQVFPLNGAGGASVDATVFPNFSARPRTAIVTVAGKTQTITQAANSLAEDERIVQLAYFNFFGRLPTQAEIAFQVNALRTGVQKSRADLFEGFARSGEFNVGGRFVAGLYVGLLNRDAEFGGWLFQRNAMSKGIVDGVSLVRNFLNSGEYRARFGEPDNAAFIRLLYRYVLLREAGQSEVDFHAATLAGGLSRVQVATNFLNSAEFRVGTGPRLSGFLLYATILNRDPSSTELAARIADLQGGASLLELMRTILDSAEFREMIR